MADTQTLTITTEYVVQLTGPLTGGASDHSTRATLEEAQRIAANLRAANTMQQFDVRVIARTLTERVVG